MAEPEDVIIEATHFATTMARSLWLRYSGPDTTPQLADIHRRLSFFISTLFQNTPEIGAAEPPVPRSFLARLAAGMPPAHVGPLVALASTDGSRIRLPPSLQAR